MSAEREKDRAAKPPREGQVGKTQGTCYKVPEAAEKFRTKKQEMKKKRRLSLGRKGEGRKKKNSTK